MNTAIWKYALEIGDTNLIQMPEGAEALTVQTQHGSLCLWAKVNPDVELEDRLFVIHGTGHAIKDAQETYIGTAQMADGALVWHVFEVPITP